MSERLIILCLITAIQIVPYVFLILLVFKKYMNASWKYIPMISLALIVILFLISRFSIPIIETRAWGRLVLDTLSALFLSMVLFFFSDFTAAQSTYLIFALTTVNDAMKLLVFLTFPNGDESYVFTWKYVLCLAGLYLIIVPILVSFFRKLFLPLLDRVQDQKFWNYVCITPIILFFQYRFNIYPGYFNEDYIWYDAMFFTPVIWIISCFLLHYVALKGLSVMASNMQLERTLYFTERSLSAQKKQFQAIQESAETVRRLRHDFRYTILAIQSHAANNDMESILAYTDSYMETLDKTSVKSYCEHSTFNAILTYYANISEKKQIRMDISAEIPSDISISEIDLCCLIGNLLENAMEACDRQENSRRYISVKIAMKSRSIFSCIITNSYDGRLSDDGSHLLSSKRNNTQGVGLTSVNYIVQKYNGVMKISHGDSEFSISVMLLSDAA